MLRVERTKTVSSGSLQAMGKTMSQKSPKPKRKYYLTLKRHVGTWCHAKWKTPVTDDVRLYLHEVRLTDRKEDRACQGLGDQVPVLNGHNFSVDDGQLWRWMAVQTAWVI